jgi:hypothetical protein
MNSETAHSAGGKIFKTHSFTSRTREEGKAWLALEGSSRHVLHPQPCHTPFAMITGARGFLFLGTVSFPYSPCGAKKPI